MNTFDFTTGTTPLLLSMPHSGTLVPEDIAATMTPAGREVSDTDWHVGALYEFVGSLGVSVIRSRYSRYVIDLNRPNDDHNLYPGRESTRLSPVANFDGQALYRTGRKPGEDEVARRVRTWWRPYHLRLQAELARLRDQYGVAILFEAHSIRSHVPRLFEGQLPDLNIGTAGGATCAPELLAVVKSVLEEQTNYSHVVDGRFKGGFITRAYGSPATGVHTLQLELAQHNYMEEEVPFTYLHDRAEQLQRLLKQLLQRIIAWGEAQAN